MPGRSHIGCPRLSCGSHLACAGRAASLGEERLNPHAAATLPWPQYRSWNRQVMTLQAADDSEVLTAAQVNATLNCGFWDSIAPKF